MLGLLTRLLSIEVFAYLLSVVLPRDTTTAAYPSSERDVMVIRARGYNSSLSTSVTLWVMVSPGVIRACELIVLLQCYAPPRFE